MFSMFLDEQEFTYTSSVLAKELVARGFAAPSDDAEDDPIDADSLREHLAFVVAKLDAETEARTHPETSDRHVSENLRDDARDGECRPVDGVPRVDGDGGERDGDDGKRDATPREEPRSAPEKRREDAGEIEPAYVTNAETRRTDRDEDRDDEKEKDANDGDARERRDVFAADDDDHAVDDILAESTDLDLPAVTEECGAATATAATSTGEDEGETVDGVARENRDASAAATNERRRTTNTSRGLPRRSRFGPGAGRGGRGGVRPSGGRGAGGVAGAGASGGRGGGAAGAGEAPGISGPSEPAGPASPSSSGRRKRPTRNRPTRRIPPTRRTPRTRRSVHLFPRVRRRLARRFARLLRAICSSRRRAIPGGVPAAAPRPRTNPRADPDPAEEARARSRNRPRGRTGGTAATAAEEATRAMGRARPPDEGEDRVRGAADSSERRP